MKVNLPEYLVLQREAEAAAELQKNRELAELGRRAACEILAPRPVPELPAPEFRRYDDVWNVEGRVI